MLWDELEHPEFTLVRNYSNILRNAPMNSKRTKRIEPEIMCLNTTALSRITGIHKNFGITFPCTPQKIDLLKKLYLQANEKDPYGMRSKEALINIAAFTACGKIGQDNQDKLFKFFVDNTEAEYLKEFAQTYISENETSSSLNEPQKDERTLLLEAILEDGTNRSDEKFKHLTSLVKDSTCEDVQIREYALQSTALYIKQKPNEVKEVLADVAKEKSDIGLLAQILLEKVEGKYYSKKDAELVKASLTETEAAEYKKYKSDYVVSDIQLNTAKNNFLDKALLPMKNVMKQLALLSHKTNITDDTITKFLPDETGKRTFRPNLINSGDYRDSIEGTNYCRGMITENIISQKDLFGKNKFSTLAHEFTHDFHTTLLDREDRGRLKELYEDAMENNKCLDSYASINVLEYFAQGYEAYASVYKPHHVIKCDDYTNFKTHTRFTLKEKDPDLYNFIEYCIKKYG